MASVSAGAVGAPGDIGPPARVGSFAAPRLPCAEAGTSMPRAHAYQAVQLGFRRVKGKLPPPSDSKDAMAKARYLVRFGRFLRFAYARADCRTACCPATRPHGPSNTAVDGAMPVPSASLT